ncbi:MAG: hypothetical protein R2788_18010 [Saprospiraceae bacterium]
MDLNDDCLSISNASEVVWWPQPFRSPLPPPTPDVCVGGCITLEVTLTGTPPFSLTYVTPGNPSQTANFSGLTGTLQVCVSGNVAPGSFRSLQAESLMDANCTCN